MLRITKSLNCSMAVRLAVVLSLLAVGTAFAQKQPPEAEKVGVVLDSMLANQEKTPPFAMHAEVKRSWPKRTPTSCEGEIFSIDLRYDMNKFDVSATRYDVFEGKGKPAYEKRFILSDNRLLCRQQYVGKPDQPMVAWLVPFQLN